MRLLDLGIFTTCPRFNALDAINLDTLKGTVRTSRTTKEKKEAKFTQLRRWGNLRRSQRKKMSKIFTVEEGILSVRFFRKMVFPLE